MIPIQLTIQGLYSYQEKQTIDFTTLTAANLFGIFGSVGSGKSSILEAITFAIYGKTDRLNLSGDNRNYNMMNLKSNELLIDFVFETGKDQIAYRAMVQGKRNSKRFDDVKKLDRSAYQKQGEEWIPVEPTFLEKVIGLSYDNFKRTIIIPQGQFQEFLQLGNKDRTQMMKELFNLGKFELYGKVATLETKNNGQRQNLEGQLQQLGEIDPDQVKLYQEQLAQLKIEMEEQAAQLDKMQKQDVEWKQLRELTKKLAEAGIALKKLKEQEPEFKKLETRIADYELCVMQFKHLLDSLQTSSKRLAQKTIRIQQDSEKLKKEEGEIARLEQELAKLKPDYEKRDILKLKADELGRLIQIRTLSLKIESDGERLKKGNEIWSKTSEEIETLKEEKNKQEMMLKLEKSKLPDMAVLANAKGWHVEEQSLVKQIHETQKQVKKYTETELVMEGTVKGLLRESIFAGLCEDSDLSAALMFLQAKVEAIKREHKSLEKEAGELRVKAQLQAFADGLKDGDPCPLCGAVHHPQIYSAVNSHEEELRLQHQRDEKEKQVDRINQLASRLNEQNSQRKFNAAQLKEWTQKLGELVKRQEEHSRGFLWEKYRDREALDKAFVEAEQIQASIKKKESELEALGKKLEKGTKDKERFQLEIDKIKTSLTVSQTELKTHREQLKMIVPEQYEKLTVADIGLEQEKLSLRYARLEKQFNDQTNLLTERRKLKDTLAGSLMANRKELEEEKQNNQKLIAGVQDQLGKTEFHSVEEVHRILAQPIDLAREKRRLAAYQEQLALAGNQQEQLKNEIRDKVYDTEAHRSLMEEIGKLNELSNQKNQEFGKLSELLKKLQKDLENQGALRKQLESLNLRAENIRTMKSLFKGSGFVNYISSVYLQSLCNAANDRFFQLTRQKLSLEITSDNNFQVRDFMNGGKVRSVKTLSGGQTFQAALSLALALADNIQKITESNQNFFFLDEGFGSLDKESLTIVFETLKSLRKENRIVGVISHVEDMQQEIDVHLRIDNQEERGSVIHASWRE